MRLVEGLGREEEKGVEGGGKAEIEANNYADADHEC